VLAIAILVSATLILRYVRRRKRIERLKTIGFWDIDRMDGQQFEHYLALLFQASGYSVTVTPASRDFGADLILSKNGQKIVVQAKRHRNAVGIGAVQEVNAARQYYKADDAWIVTNDYFTGSAKKLAKSTNVRLVNRSVLTEMILQVNPDLVPIPRNVLKGVPAKEMICRDCGAKMVKRKSATGEFYGCSRFPHCRNTMSI
jgi:restriction system protein